jgi:hypothetical protein
MSDKYQYSTLADADPVKLQKVINEWAEKGWRVHTYIGHPISNEGWQFIALLEHWTLVEEAREVPEEVANV